MIKKILVKFKLDIKENLRTTNKFVTYKYISIKKFGFGLKSVFIEQS